MTATTIELDRDQQIPVLRISGDITSSSEGDLMAAYGRATTDQSSVVILDFAGLAYMNSGGIGLLVTLLVRAQRGGGRLIAVGLSDHYRQIFELTRLDEAIAIHADTDAALASART